MAEIIPGSFSRKVAPDPGNAGVGNKAIWVWHCILIYQRRTPTSFHKTKNYENEV